MAGGGQQAGARRPRRPRRSGWFGAATDQAPDAAFVIDPTGRVREVNRAACESLGYAREELLGKPYLEVERDLDEAAAAELLRQLEGGGSLTLPGHHRRKDGSAIPVETRISTLELGGVRCFLAFARSTTERAYVEGALRLSEQRARARAAELEAILDCVGDGIVVYDRQGRTTRSNPSADRILGIPVEDRAAPVQERVKYQYEVLGEDGRVLRPDEMAAVRAAVHGERIRRQVVRLRRTAGGAPRWLSLSATPLELEGRHAGAVLSIRDVTELREADEELRRLAAAVEQTPASIVITDEAGTILYVNPGYERVTGYTRAESIGRKANLVRSDRHDRAFYAAMWKEIASGRVWKGQIVNRAKDGHLFTEDAVIAPVVGRDGKVRNYVAVKRDVTEELQLREELAHAQRMESIGRLAGGVAHDFNNLLTVVLSAAASLREELSAGRRPDEALVEEIVTAAQRASELTRQLLAFARRQVVTPKPLDLNETLRGLERLLRRAAGEEAELQLALQPDLWTVRCDRGQLEQVVMNLVVNARDAVTSGGTIRIDTANVRAEPGAPSGDAVRLVVRDDGIGMAPEVLAHLFEPFFTTKERGKGSGLGLATVYGIVRQNGGEIRVESSPDVGSAFEIRLPRWLGPVEAAQAGGARAAARGTESVLLVEDEPAVRHTVSRALRDGGYAVEVAASAAEALELLEDGTYVPSLIVTDVVMPGMNGRQLVERVRARHPGLPALFVSGYSYDVTDPDGGLGEDVDFLQKPFTPELLREKVRAVLDRVDRDGR